MIRFNEKDFHGFISFIINVRKEGDCKEKNIMNSKKSFKIHQFDY